MLLLEVSCSTKTASYGLYGFLNVHLKYVKQCLHCFLQNLFI